MRTSTMTAHDCTLGGAASKPAYTAVIKLDGPWWIGWIDEVPGVNCQETSQTELTKSLGEALGEMLEMNRSNRVFERLRILR